MQIDPTQFDKIIERRGTNCSKWDGMQARYDVPAADGLPMWVADMDFRPPEAVSRALQRIVDHGIYGYSAGHGALGEAVRWWMAERHDWHLDPSHVFHTDGLVNAVALCLDTYTAPGDGIVLFTPVYHAFSRIIAAAGRRVVECPMPQQDNRYVMDFDAWDAAMTGGERMVILCSPHNPGGNVWSREELEGVAAFAERHDLLLISDEIHHDLVFPDAPRHIPMSLIDEVSDRLIMLTAASKTFNLAGAHLGQVTIADEALRAPFAARMAALAMGPGALAPPMIAAAYSAEGAAWVDALMVYLQGNRDLFDTAIAAIPGLRSIPLDATYLAWVDFSGTGMAPPEFIERVEKVARIAANHGDSFGTGGESYLRFNLGTPRANVAEAAERLAHAFADLQ